MTENTADGTNKRAELIGSLQSELISSLKEYKHFHRSLAQELLPEAPVGSFAVLMTLYANDRVNGQMIANHIGLDKGAISRYLQILLTAGLVERFTDPEDGRSSLWAINPATKNRLQEAKESHLASWRIKLDGWPEEKLELLFTLLQELNSNLG